MAIDTQNVDMRDVSEEEIHWDQDLSYGGYLSLRFFPELWTVRTEIEGS
jgi:hypothetical protein